MVSPSHHLMACSPDGLDTVERTGYEYKTKDRVCVPADCTAILNCEYLQCQMCLWCCQGIVDRWLICYNRLDTNEFKAYHITLDTQLMESHILPLLVEFVDKVLAAEEEYAGMHRSQVEGGEIDWQEFIDRHKYPRMHPKVKADMLQRLQESKRQFAHPIQLQLDISSS